MRYLAKSLERHESKRVSFDALKVRILEGLDGCLSQGPVHPFDLAVGLRVVRAGEFMLDAVFSAGAIEDVASEHGSHGRIALPVIEQIGSHAVVGQHCMDGVGGRP